MDCCCCGASDIGVGIKSRYAVKLDHSHVIVVANRVSRAGVVPRRSENPKVQVLALTRESLPSEWVLG